MEPYQVVVEVSKLEEKTFARQMAEKVIAHCQSLGVPKIAFGMDTTGAQSILADFIDEIWEEDGKIYRCEFGGKASDLQASEKDSKLASDLYANRVTELWFNMVAFGRNGQIRNLPVEALRQFTIREMVSSESKRMRTTKRQIEPKPIMKQRTGGKSPDEADACCVCLDLARQRLNIHPGMNNIPQSTGRTDRFVQEHDLDSSDEIYLTDGFET